jgi:hypothetical protein
MSSPACVSNTVRDPEGRFSGLPITTHYVDGVTYILAGDVSYRARDERVTTVRANFAFDWASVPRFFWRIFPPAGVARPSELEIAGELGLIGD